VQLLGARCEMRGAFPVDAATGAGMLPWVERAEEVEAEACWLPLAVGAEEEGMVDGADSKQLERGRALLKKAGSVIRWQKFVEMLHKLQCMVHDLILNTVTSSSRCMSRHRLRRILLVLLLLLSALLQILLVLVPQILDVLVATQISQRFAVFPPSQPQSEIELGDEQGVLELGRKPGEEVCSGLREAGVKVRDFTSAFL